MRDVDSIFSKLKDLGLGLMDKMLNFDDQVSKQLKTFGFLPEGRFKYEPSASSHYQSGMNTLDIVEG